MLYFFYRLRKPKANHAEEKNIKKDENSATDNNDANEKDQDESTPFLNNDQLPEAELYDGICGEARVSDSMSSYYSYEVRQMQNFEALERDRL